MLFIIAPACLNVDKGPVRGPSVRNFQVFLDCNSTPFNLKTFEHLIKRRDMGISHSENDALISGINQLEAVLRGF